jgi:hypothetical protein
VKALTRTLDVPLKKKSSVFGFYFEHFLILEIKKLSDYKKKQWDMSYLITKDDNEIDLLLTQLGQPTYCIEIKSTEKIVEEHLKNFMNLTKDIKNSKAYCFSCDPHEKQIGHVRCMPWQMGLRELGLVK